MNGIQISGVYTEERETVRKFLDDVTVYDGYDELLKDSDAVYIITSPKYHYRDIKHALELGKHVLCESPIAISKEECEELFALAEEKGCVLMYIYRILRNAQKKPVHNEFLLHPAGRNICGYFCRRIWKTNEFQVQTETIS